MYGVKCRRLKALKVTIFPIFFPRHPKSYQNRNINPPKSYDDHPRQVKSSSGQSAVFTNRVGPPAETLSCSAHDRESHVRTRARCACLRPRLDPSTLCRINLKTQLEVRKRNTSFDLHMKTDKMFCVHTMALLGVFRWLFTVRTSSSRSPFHQQSHIINILLASFARSVRQVMDPRFSLHCFHGPRASRLGHKWKEKTQSITCRTDLALG